METAWNLAELIERSKTGDREAFAEIVKQYQSIVCGVAYSVCGDFHRSEDIAQETFLVAWNKLGELAEPEHFLAWTCAIARNLANLSFRKKSVGTVHDSLAIGRESSEPRPDAELLRKEQNELVWSAIGEIEQPYRETLILYYRSGQSVREIAAATDATEEAVRQRLVRARKSLKTKLETLIGDILTDSAPGEWFTVAVVAAIPPVVLGTAAKTLLAATEAAGIGGSSAGGSSAPLSPPGTIGIFLGSFFFVLAMLVPGLLFFWSMIRNSPTLRTRRFTLQVGSIIVWWSFLTLGFTTLIYSLDVMKFSDEAGLFGTMIILPGVTVFFILGLIFPRAVLGKERTTWRTIYEADRENPEQIAMTLEKSSWAFDSIVFCQRRIVCSLFGIATFCTGILYFSASNILVPCVGGSVLFSFVIIYSGFVRDSLAMMRTTADLEKHPPMLPTQLRYPKTDDEIARYHFGKPITPLTPQQKRHQYLMFNSGIALLFPACLTFGFAIHFFPRTEEYLPFEQNLGMFVCGCVIFAIQILCFIGVSLAMIDLFPRKRKQLLAFFTLCFLVCCWPLNIGYLENLFWSNGWFFSITMNITMLFHILYQGITCQRQRKNKRNEEAGLPPIVKPELPVLWFDPPIDWAKAFIHRFCRSWLTYKEEMFPAPDQVSRILWPITLGIMLLYVVIPLLFG